MNIEDKIHWVYSSQSIQELETRYDEWAYSYDSHLAETTGYAIPQATMLAVNKLLDPTAKILDAGAGTGLTGETLFANGYKDLHAIDLSEQMLAVAASKKIYESLLKMKLGDELDFVTDKFDAVVVTGVFTTGHAKPESLDELARVTKSEGHIIFSINLDAYENLGFRQKMDQLSEIGTWKEVYCSEEFKGLPNYETEVFHRVWGFKIL